MARQLGLKMPCGWGGRRKGAGKRARAGGQRSRVSHGRRPVHNARHPVHVTMRAGDDVPSLRSPRVFAEVRASVMAASTDSFQVVQFSAQRDHLHLIVEADDGRALTSGMSGFAVRCARAVNRAAGRRGRVWADRYHSDAKESPTKFRHALIYVLFNFKKHDPGNATGLDRCSSAPWFNGFRESIPAETTLSPVRLPRTWLAREGWLKAGGLVSIHAAPAADG
jgi:putative transposase